MQESSSIAELFSWLNPKCYYQNGRTRYERVERHCFLRYRHAGEWMDSMLLRCTLYSRTRSWTGDYHHRIRPPFLNVGFVHSGETAIRCNEQYFLAEAGDLFFLPPETDYEILTPRLCERSGVLISGPILSNILMEKELCCHPVRRLENPGVVERWFDQVDALLPESYSLPVCRKISGLCFELLQFLSAPDRGQILPAVLNTALEKIRREYGKALDVESLASHSGVSASTLTRLFKRHLGKSPHQYLIGLRMRQAARMLEEHSLSVKEIAERVGYGNALNFSTEFRKFFGKSPRNWSSVETLPDRR